MSDMEEYIRSCRYCPYKIRDRKRLRQHELECGSDKKFTCQVCLRNFDHKNSYEGHIRRHVPVLGGVACIYCNDSFTDKLLLDEHLPIHEEFDMQRDNRNCAISKCPKCDFMGKFPTVTHHFRTHSDPKTEGTAGNQLAKAEYIRPCRYCSIEIKDRRLLIEHEQNCGVDRPVRCTICPRKFKNDNLLKQHLDSHKKNSVEGGAECIYCGEKFPDKISLFEHAAVHEEFDLGRTLGGDRMSKCPKCDFVCTLGYANLLKHMDRHLDVKKYKCNLCSSSFRCLDDLTKHKYRHKDVGRHKCRYCGLDFHASEKKRDHQKNHFDPQGNLHFICHECGEDMKTPENFLSHCKMHSREKGFQCEYCDRILSNDTKRKNHILLLHQGDKPYACTVCDETFADPSSKTEHEQLHLKKKQKRCMDCNIEFEDNLTFEFHIKSHPDYKRYECTFCGMRFASQKDWSSHELVHINGESSQEEYPVKRKRKSTTDNLAKGNDDTDVAMDESLADQNTVSGNVIPPQLMPETRINAENFEETVLPLACAVLQTSLEQKDKTLIVLTKRMESDLLVLAKSCPSIYLITETRPIFTTQRNGKATLKKVAKNPSTLPIQAPSDRTKLYVTNFSNIHPRLMIFESVDHLEKELKKKKVKQLAYFVRNTNRNSLKIVSECPNRKITVASQAVEQVELV